MYLEGLRSQSARILREGYSDDEPLGETRTGKTIETAGHAHYSAAVALPGSAHPPMSVHQAMTAEGAGAEHAGAMLAQRLGDWTAGDHQDAARRHSTEARSAVEHHGIFKDQYGEAGDGLSEADRERYLSTLAELVAAAAAHRGVAAAHLAAAAKTHDPTHLTSGPAKRG